MVVSLLSRVYMNLCRIYDQDFKEKLSEEIVGVVEFNYNWGYDEIAQQVIKTLQLEKGVTGGMPLTMEELQFFNQQYTRLTYSEFIEDNKECWLEELVASKQSPYLNFMILEGLNPPFSLSDRCGLLSYKVSFSDRLDRGDEPL